MAIPSAELPTTTLARRPIFSAFYLDMQEAPGYHKPYGPTLPFRDFLMSWKRI